VLAFRPRLFLALPPFLSPGTAQMSMGLEFRRMVDLQHLFDSAGAEVVKQIAVLAFKWLTERKKGSPLTSREKKEIEHGVEQYSSVRSATMTDMIREIRVHEQAKTLQRGEKRTAYRGAKTTIARRTGKSASPSHTGMKKAPSDSTVRSRRNQSASSGRQKTRSKTAGSRKKNK